MTDITPLTAEDLAALRREHVRYVYTLLTASNGVGQACAACQEGWPCTIARLLEMVSIYEQQTDRASRAAGRDWNYEDDPYV